MQVSALLAGWRGWASDSGKQFWSDEELLAYLTEGQDEAAKRRIWIIDGETPAVCRYPVRSGEPLIPLHRAILRPRSVTLRSTGKQLALAYAGDMNPIAGWEAIAGTPEKWIPNYSDGALRLYPIPVQDDELGLTVWRLPILPLTMDGELEVRRVWERHVLHWVTYRAYLKPGPNTYAPPRAMGGLAEFEATFGPPRERVWERMDG